MPVMQTTRAKFTIPALLGFVFALVTSIAVAGIVYILTRRAGIQLDPRALLVIPWFALNSAGFIFFRRRRPRPVQAEFLPISLGARTYRSGTNVGA